MTEEKRERANYLSLEIKNVLADLEYLEGQENKRPHIKELNQNQRVSIHLWNRYIPVDSELGGVIFRNLVDTLKDRLESLKKEFDLL